MVEEQYILKRPTWWKRRTVAEKILFGITLVLTASIISISSVRLSKNNERNICLTPSCVKASVRILQLIDQNVDPCNDFYKFSCGNYEKHHFLSEDEPLLSHYISLRNLNLRKLKIILENPIGNFDYKYIISAKTLYQSCKNTSAIKEKSISTLQQLFQQSGGWPVVEGENWNEKNFDWKTTTYNFYKLGFDYEIFFSHSIQPDRMDIDKYILTINQPNYPNWLRKGFNDSIVQAIYSYMVNSAVRFGANQEKASQEMKEVIDLLIELVRMTELRPFSHYNTMAVKELQRQFPYVSWLSYINTLFHHWKGLSENDTIVLKSPDYFFKLKNVLKHTPKRVLANTMYWWQINFFAKYLGNDIHNLLKNYSKLTTGVEADSPKWKECLEEVSIQMSPVIGSLYIKNIFDNKTKLGVVDLVNNIRSSFMNILRNLDWIDNVTRKHVLEKAAKPEKIAAYPKELIDDSKLEEYYQGLVVDSTKYLDSIRNCTLFERRKKTAKFGTVRYGTTRNWWRFSNVYEVNVFYISSDNIIYLPAGILQGVFYENDRPQYLNYGSIGVIVGHELTHSFHDISEQNDQNGNSLSGWHSESKVFNKKRNCIIDQYSDIIVPETNSTLNGYITQVQNLADNGSVKPAYQAYQKSIEKHGPELHLPGLPYTPEQLFWISFGNTKCSLIRKELFKFNLIKTLQAPDKYRINVPAMNSEYFAKIFNCPRGSPMNPEHKCHVW